MGYGNVAGKNLDDLPKENEPLAAGWYNVTVIKVEDKATRNGDGGYLNFQLEVNGPSNAGRHIFAMHLYQHSNPTAEQMGLAKLRSLARAMGRTVLPRDTLSWCGQRVQAHLKVKPAQNGYEAGNEVTAYQAIERIQPPVGGGQQQSAPAQQGGYQSPIPGDDGIPF
jgi:hypothetical protein